MTDFTKIYKDELENKTVEKVQEPEIQEPDNLVFAKPGTIVEEPSFTTIHEIRESLTKEMTDEIVNSLREQVEDQIRKELTESLTKSIKKEIKTQSANANLKLAKAIENLTNKIDNLNENLKIEIPAPVINAVIPRRTQKVIRDKNGLIESIQDVDDD